MSSDIRYAMLDRPDILLFAFYTRKDSRKGPSNSADYTIPVGDGVSIGCRFYIHDRSSPSILFFHGNGEVVGDYDNIAPVYNQMGINLFVADYRGYGSSGGAPTFASTIDDAHRIFRAFLEIRHDERYTGDVFVMGRSLGSLSAIELAFSGAEHLKGLIVESGFAGILRLLKFLGFSARPVGIDDESFPNAFNMRSVKLPTLILHGERDSLIPVSEARELFENTVSEAKSLVIIDGANHNDIMVVDMERYFGAIREFVIGKGLESRL